MDRADLPDNEVVPAAHRRWYEDAESSAPLVDVSGGHTEPAPARRGWLISLLVSLAIAVVLGTAWGVDSSQVVIVALLIGIPVGLAAAVTIAVARRNR